MTRILRTLTLLLLLGNLACGGSAGTSTASFDTTIYTPHHAAGFVVRGSDRGRSTLLCIRDPWQGARGVEQQLLLLRGDERVPEGFRGQVTHAPVKRVVCMSSSHVAMFDALSQTRRVVGVSGMEYIMSPHVNEHKFCGEIRDVGYDTNLNFELLVSLRPDLVMLYGVTGENTAVTGKLSELGIPYVYIGDYVEESPLGKTEWLVAVAEAIDQRAFGCELFDGICRRYEELRGLVDTIAVHPRVMLNIPYRDTWFMPSRRSYMVRLIEDAGGSYVYDGNESNASVPVTLEEAYLLAGGADYWLNVGQLNTLDALKAQNPRFTAIPAVESGCVYNNNRRQTPAGGSDFWESGVVFPDRVLRDLIAILHPELLPEKRLYYYQRLE